MDATVLDSSLTAKDQWKLSNTERLTEIFSCKADPAAAANKLNRAINIADDVKLLVEDHIGLTKTNDGRIVPRLEEIPDLVQKKYELLECDPRTQTQLAQIPEVLKDYYLRYPTTTAQVVAQPAEIGAPKPQIYMVTPERTDGSLDGRMKWDAYKQTLEHAGADVVAVEAGKSRGMSGKETWTRDVAVKVGDHLFVPDGEYGRGLGFDYDTGHRVDADIRQFSRTFGKDDLNIHQMKDTFFEGGNIIVDEKTRTILYGYDDQRNTEDSARNFIKQVNEVSAKPYDMIIVPLTFREMKGHAYHLDLALSEPLAQGEMLVHPASIDPHTYERMKEKLGADRFVEISDKDAKAFATNLVPVGTNLVMTAASPELQDTLKRRGYQPMVPIDGESPNGGALKDSGVHCLTQILPLKAVTTP